MVDTINPHWAANRKKINWIFISMGLILLFYTIYSAFASPESVKDCLLAFIIVGIFYAIQMNYHVPLKIIIAGFLPILTHLSGAVFGLYEILILGFGYDKIIHFVNAFSGTIVIFYLLIAHSKKIPVLKTVAAMLIIIGIGAIVENIEFTGSKYLDMKGPTILSQDGFSAETKATIMQRLSLSPTIQMDLINHDTEWDMLFNTFGTILGALVISVLWVIDKRNLGNRGQVVE